MPSNVSRNRRQKAFNRGRRAAAEQTTINPYENAKLKALWDSGRAKQQAGELKTPIPALEHGQTRAGPINKNSAPRPASIRPASGTRNPTNRTRQPKPRPRW